MGTQNDTVDGGISEWTWGKRGPDPGQVLGATHLTGGSLSLLLRSLTHRLPFWDTVAESSTKNKKISLSFEYFDNPSGSFIHTVERSISTRGIRV